MRYAPDTNTVHRLGYTIKEPDRLDGYPVFMVTVNSLAQSHYFLLLPLEMSARQNGVFPILLCPCGGWRCKDSLGGGYYVDVKNDEKHVIWESLHKAPDSRAGSALQAPKPIYSLKFTRANYEAVIAELLTLKDKYPQEKSNYKRDKTFYSQHKIFAQEAQ